MESEYRRLEGGRDEQLRSRGERLIARLLEDHGIAYQYEYPLAVIDQGKTKIWYPDFRLPEYGMMIEYFGMNGSPDYDERTRHKMQVYSSAGMEGLFLKSEVFQGDWPGKILGQIEDVLKNRLARFYSRRSR